MIVKGLVISVLVLALLILIAQVVKPVIIIMFPLVLFVHLLLLIAQVAKLVLIVFVVVAVIVSLMLIVQLAKPVIIIHVVAVDPVRFLNVNHHHLLVPNLAVLMVMYIRRHILRVALELHPQTIVLQGLETI